MKKSTYIPLLLILSLCSLNSCKEKKHTSHSPAGERTEEKNTHPETQVNTAASAPTEAKITLQETVEEAQKRKLDALKKKREAAVDVLHRAIKINQEEIFTLEEAKNKGVTIVCSPEDADLLLHIILNHDEKDDNGHLCWGPDSIGTARVACVMLGIAAKHDPAICEKVFTTLAEHATKMEPVLLDELLDRLTKTDIKNLNRKLNALADNLGTKEHADVLAIIWGYKVRLASIKDKDRVMRLIKTKNLDADLLDAVSAYTFELIKSTDNKEEKSALGEQIWEAVKNDESSLNNQAFMRMLAYICQPDALEYYKGKMEDKENWKQYSPFFAAWQNDDIVAYLCELRSQCAPDDEKHAKIIDITLMRVFTQDRERSVEEAMQFLAMAYDDFFADTTALQELIEKDETRTPEEEEEYQRLEKIVKQQTQVVESLGNYCKAYYDWVDAVLNKIEEECNNADSYLHKKLSNTAKKVRKLIQENEARTNKTPK